MSQIMNFSGKRCAVTGGLGFIGSHISEELLRLGSEVVIIDNMSAGTVENKILLEELGAKIHVSDILSDNSLPIILEKIDYVFHTAAIVSVPYTVKHPNKSYMVNVEGTKKVLDASIQNHVKKLIFSSSCAVYGDSKSSLIKEKTAINPGAPYGTQKSKSEIICKIFSESENIDAVSLRYFNVYGPRQSVKSEYSAVIPLFIKSLLNKEKPKVYGTGDQVRDFIFVKDVVKANLLSASLEGSIKSPLNICTGKGHSINEVLKILCEIIGVNIEPRYLDSRSGDIQHSVGNPSLSQKIINFQNVLSFREGLRQTVSYFRDIDESN